MLSTLSDATIVWTINVVLLSMLVAMGTHVFVTSRRHRRDIRLAQLDYIRLLGRASLAGIKGFEAGASLYKSLIPQGRPLFVDDIGTADHRIPFTLNEDAETITTGTPDSLDEHASAYDSWRDDGFSLKDELAARRKEYDAGTLTP